MWDLTRYPGVAIERTDDVTVCRFLETEPGRSEDVGTIARILYRLANEEGGRYVVLNLTDVRWMSSEVINALFVLYRKLQASGGALVLCHVGPFMEEVLDAVRFTDLATVFTDEREAIRGLDRLPTRRAVAGALAQVPA